MFKLQKKNSSDQQIILLNPSDFAGGLEGASETSSLGPAVSVQNNHIYLYDQISQQSMVELAMGIRQAEVECLKQQAVYGAVAPMPIHLHINSFGGDAYAGLAGLGHIRACRVPIYTYVEGSVASAATFLSMAGTRRYMTKHSFMLIHQISTWFSGTYENLKDEKESIDALMEMLLNFYKDNSKIKKRELTNLLKRDLWLTPEQCLAWGLIDEVK
jgi:ATP-dependent protease ClpP protease subunit